MEIKKAIKHSLLIVPDKLYVQWLYFRKFKKRLNLENVQTYNEKIQWIKLYSRKSEYTMMADKYAVRGYIAKKIGSNYSITLVGGPWKSFDDIDFAKLPEQFVLKCTHDSGSVIICKDKSNFDINKARKSLTAALRWNYYIDGREWQYKNIPPRIIAEQYMEDADEHELRDYKFFCFNGVVNAIQVDFDRYINHKRNFYDVEWNYLDFSLRYPTNPKHEITKPEALEEMISLAEKLSHGIPHVRVDLYYANKNVYFGELTFTHGCGFERFTPPDWDKHFGSLIDL
jgi:hypothetical protein